MTPLALIAVLALVPQEPPGPAPGPDPKPSPVEVLDQAAGGGQDEMVELFAAVERRLREIDRMLYDASAGRPVEGAEESGIDELLRKSRENSKQVLEGIDRILELAAQRAEQQRQQQQGSGGQQQQQSQQGDSPLDRRQDGQPGERERTPEGASAEREGNEPQQQEGEQDGQRPDSPHDSQDEAANREGDNPPTGASERVPNQGGDERWGDLPVRVRELFRGQGGGDMPPRYRDWIDAYYRRLNERP